MNCVKKNLWESLLLYAVTDRAWLGHQTLTGQVEEALRGGATFLQLREKELNRADFLEEALAIKALCGRYGVPFVINDNVQVALDCDADGVHVGQEDMAAALAREKLGEEKLLGVSVQTVEQAVRAEKDGADYLGVGAVFATSTKPDADAVSFDTLRKICDSVTIPVVAIGGINQQNLTRLRGSGIVGVAVVSAIFAQKDIAAATAQLKSLTEKMVKG